MTVRYSIAKSSVGAGPVLASAANDDNPFAFHPGGRWERILAGCVRESRPLTRAEVLAHSRSRRQDHGTRVERQKLNRALMRMTKAGLLATGTAADERATWAPTAAGLRALLTYGAAA